MAGLLAAIGLQCGRGFCAGSRLGIGLVEDGLDNLLLVRAKNLDKVLVELRLFWLEVYEGG